MGKLITSAMVWNADNVSSFRGYDINSAGEVELSDGEYIEMLDDIYGTVTVCGSEYSTGSVLQDCDPTAFRCGKGDEESRLTAEFEEALDNEDESEIKFSEFEPFEINEDDPEEDAADDE